MTPAEFKERMADLAEISRGDTEANRYLAELLLLECLRSLGYGEGCDIYEQIEKWYA
jgi:hypothetical protein